MPVAPTSSLHRKVMRMASVLTSPDCGVHRRWPSSATKRSRATHMGNMTGPKKALFTYQKKIRTFRSSKIIWQRNWVMIW